MEFSKIYNRKDFLYFLRRDFLPDDFEQVEEAIEFTTQTTYLLQATKLGICKSLDLVVYEIKHNSKDDPRVGLSKEAFRMLYDEWQSRALVLFVPKSNPNNYRFSLIEIKLEDDQTSAKIHRKYSNPRRYSYLLGEGIGGYTPNKLLAKGKIGENDCKDLQERFSVEVLTKAFYNELSDWYAWAIDNVEFPGEHLMDTKDKRTEHRSKNVIRLLIRLLFVWFLKQKNLIPWQLFDEDYLSNNILKDFSPNLKTGLFVEKSQESKYYRAILQNLFFATLNCPIVPQSKEDSRERRFRKSDWYGQRGGEDHLMRYERDFLDAKHFLELVNERVPFLNGGLFDCLDDKQNNVYIDGFSDNLLKPNTLKVPDFLFFGEVQGKGQDVSSFYGDKKKKSTDILGLVDILKKYNFTIEENRPFDQEISLDPELLGKVFENLLASYNPETKTTARKQTGSFYTPREIVQYMVDESLIAHLKCTVGEDLEEEYRKLMRYTDEEFLLTDDKRLAIIQSLQNCKVFDPACGSGAFAVGMLQQMVHILSQLDPNNKLWKNLIINDAVRELSSTSKECTTEELEEIQTDINRNFDGSLNRPDYARKLYLIENCIYGVDIQSIAVQISKLRFFISLVVDQKPTQDRNENFGIRPLPNLDAKFVAANTLIGIKKIKMFFEDPKTGQLQDKLVQASYCVFGAKNNKAKNKYKARVEELQNQIAGHLETHGVVDSEDARLMRSWKMFDQNTSSPFFDPEWMFGVSGGFNIVIGNPPYVLLQNTNINEKTREKLKLEFISAQYKIDLYHLFIEYGLKILNKNNGVLAFITPLSYLKNKHNDNLRKYIISTSCIVKLVRFFIPIFENASVDNSILICQKQMKSNHSICLLDVYNSYTNINNESKRDILQSSITPNEYLFNFDIGSSHHKGILDKINKGNILKTYASAYFGIQTFDRKKFVSTIQINRNFMPVVDGGNVFRYYLTPHKEYVMFEKNAIKSGGNPKVYNSERILVRQIGKYPEGTLCRSGIYTLNTIYNIYLLNDTLSIKYLLALINSSVLRYFWVKSYSDAKETFPKIKKQPLESLPIIEVNYNKQQPLINLVDKILDIKQINRQADTTVLENEIDLLVYRLYDLTYEEVLTIDSQTPISRQQYEAI